MYKNLLEGGRSLMLCCGRTDIGRKRQVNQDTFICETFDNGMMLAVVCDGMGGASGGGMASGLACGNFVESFSKFAEDFPRKEKISRSDERNIKQALVDAINAANKKVYDRSMAVVELYGMGTTIVVVLAVNDLVFTVSVGDSRAYLIHRNTIKQITHDHSYVQYLVDIGKMSVDEARTSSNRNIITRAVGTDFSVESDVFVTRIHKRSYKREYTVLLCTDGLTNHLDDKVILNATINACSIETNRALGHLCEELVDLANEAGGSDNVTAVLMTI